MAGATVDVFLNPGYASNSKPAVGSKRSFPLLGSGTTNASGVFASSLNTALIKGHLGDTGTGIPDAFNALVIATGPARERTVRYMILKLGSSTSASIRAHPVTTSWTPTSSSQVTTSASTLTQTYLSTKYTYIKVLAETSSNGMKAHFEYTYDSSTGVGIQTSASVVISGTGVSPWTVSGSAEESTSRQYSRPKNVSGDYHSNIFVNYSFHKSLITYCSKFCSSYYAWEIGSWTGAITDDDPNPACNHCSYSVGVVPYKYPAYTTNPNYSTPLTTSSPSATRNQGQTFNYSFKFDFAGFVGVTARSSYGSITSVTWTRLSSGCSAPRSPNVWGNGYPPAQAPIEQANCFKQPT